MKFRSENKEEAEKMMEELNKLTHKITEKMGIPKESLPKLMEYLNEELLELHYCRKGTTMEIMTKDPDTIMIMMADIIGHLLSEVPEDKRNDVLLMAIKTASLDDLPGTKNIRKK